MIVNSSRGGGSKDTWVLAGPTNPVEPAAEPLPDPVPVLSDDPVVAASPAGGRAETAGPALTALHEQAEQQQQARGHAARRHARRHAGRHGKGARPC